LNFNYIARYKCVCIAKKNLLEIFDPTIFRPRQQLLDTQPDSVPIFIFLITEEMR